MSHNAIKNEIKFVTGVKSNLAAESNFIALKGEVNKLYFNKLVNVPASLNDLKIKVDYLDIDQFKAVPKLKKIKLWSG